LGYCAELAELEKRIRELIREDVEGAGAKVEFRSECEEKRELFTRTSLEPTKFKTPPDLYIRCQDRSCNIMLHVKTSPAKAREIESWARGKGLFVTKAPLMLMRVLPPGELAIEVYAPLEELDRKLDELLGAFKREVDK
jgi:hypothetical protein